jgi:hypothetical protein
MTVVALKGFAAGETVNVYPFAIGELWARQMQQTPPGTPTATGAASAGGAYSPDLPDNLEFLALGVTSRRTKQVLNAVTIGGSVPWAPAV